MSVALVLLLGAPSAVVAQAEGAYRFTVFGSTSSDTVATGTFVVSPAGFDLSLFPDSFVSRVREEAFWLLARDPVPNTCFGFNSSREFVEGREFYGGIYAYGFAVSDLSQDSTQVRVYQSPDASQALVATFGSDVVRGAIYQWDYDRHQTHAPVEWLPFEAQRMGDADLDACRRAIEGGVARDQPPAF